MRFQTLFKRRVGATPASDKVLGSDTAPTGAPDQTKDNQFQVLFRDINGWPVHRIAIGYGGPAGALTLTAALYIFDRNSGLWLKLGPVPTANLVPSEIAYFDMIVPVEVAQTSGNLAKSVGNSADLALVVTPAGGDPNGEYTFVAAGDLTTIGYDS